MNPLEESIKNNVGILDKLASYSNTIKILNRFDIVYTNKTYSDNLLESALNENNEIYSTIGYEIQNIGNIPIKNISYLDSNQGIKEKTLNRNETMYIQSSFLTLLLTRPEYSFKVLDNELIKKENVEDIEDIFNSYEFINEIPQIKIGLYNVMDKSLKILPKYKKEFYPLISNNNRKGVKITSKTAQLLAELISN